jgi:PPIC-type PPIASE domain
MRVQTLVILVAAGLNAQCGEHVAPQPAVAIALPADMPAANASDTIVAQVNGHPVWASCVQAQAHAMELDAPAALQQCIDFELLAQTATARGRNNSPELATVQRDQMVSSFVAREFETKYRTPDDLPADMMKKMLAKNSWRLHRVDYRASTFMRFGVPEKDAGSPADLDAKANAEALYAELKDQHGMFASHAIAIATRVAGTAKFETGNADMADASRLVKPYSDALFALPAIGDVTPPTRTPWGWDIILFTDQLPPRDITEAELRAELFPGLRQSYFAFWVNTIAKGLRAKAVVSDAVNALLDPSSETLPAPP